MTNIFYFKAKDVEFHMEPSSQPKGTKSTLILTKERSELSTIGLRKERSGLSTLGL